MKKWVVLVLLVFCIGLVGKGWHTLKGGFSVRRLEGSFPFMNQAVRPLSSEALGALKQRYSYLGHGRQCYAFVSEDGQYVLKLPRMDSYRVSVRNRLFRKRAHQQMAVRQKRKAELAKSFLIADQELGEITESLYCHLDPTTHIGFSVEVSDALGRRFGVDLDKRPFFLQRKRANLTDVFLQAVAQKNIPYAQSVLEAYLKLIIARAEKGVANKDAAFLDNFGFDGKKAMQIDVGTFYHKSEQAARSAIPPIHGRVSRAISYSGRSTASLPDEESPSFQEGVLQMDVRETADQMGAWVTTVSPELGAWFKTRVGQIVR